MTSKQINFMGVPAVPLKNARFVVLPLPYEKTTSYGQGTARGPRAILSASTQVELFDEELGILTYQFPLSAEQAPLPDGHQGTGQAPLFPGERAGQAVIHTINRPPLNFKKKPEVFLPFFSKRSA